MDSLHIPFHRNCLGCSEPYRDPHLSHTPLQSQPPGFRLKVFLPQGFFHETQTTWGEYCEPSSEEDHLPNGGKYEADQQSQTSGGYGQIAPASIANGIGIQKGYP